MDEAAVVGPRLCASPGLVSRPGSPPATRPVRLGEEVGHDDLAGDDLGREVADLVLDLLGDRRRRVEVIEDEERRADAVLGEAVVATPPSKVPAARSQTGVVHADVGPLHHRLDDVRRIERALVGVDAGGEEVPLLGGLEDAGVAGRREREDVLRALVVLGQRELLARRRIVEAGAPAEEHVASGLTALTPSSKPTYQRRTNGRSIAPTAPIRVGRRKALVLAGGEEAEDGAEEVGALVLLEHEAADVRIPVEPVSTIAHFWSGYSPASRVTASTESNELATMRS